MQTSTESTGIPPPLTAPLDLACRGCGARLAIPAGTLASRCPFCTAPWVVDRPATRDRPDPHYALGFQVDAERARALVRAWIQKRALFAPRGLASAALEGTHGVYVPAYLCSAVGRARWRAEIGEDYQVTETYTTTDGKGRTVTRTRTVTKTEWRPLAGNFSGWVRDVLVTASHGLPNAELAALEPFDLRLLRRFEPGLVAGFLAEEPTLALDACRAQAQGEAERELQERIAAFLPGDHQRGLEVESRLEEECVELVLLPVWVFAARWSKSKPPVRILVNGESGEVRGRVPVSPWRVGFAVLAGLALIALVVLFLLWAFR